MPRSSFDHVDTWIFDLDHTLYPPQSQLFSQIETRMTSYVMRVLDVDAKTADRLRGEYWRDYGTTLSGLMACHDIDPLPFLADVHDISFDVLDPDPDLAKAISSLGGRRIVYTNGDASYAAKVLAARGLTDVFHDVYGIEHADFHPKPREDAFSAIRKKEGFEPTRAAMFEDDVRNLAVPKSWGMRTVHVAPTPEPADHIDYHTDMLTDFLQALRA